VTVQVNRVLPDSEARLLMRMPCPQSLSASISRSWLLIALGAVAAGYLPVLRPASSRGGPKPGQNQPILFYSPDCPECQQCMRLVPMLVRKMEWERPLLVDSRFVRKYCFVSVSMMRLMYLQLSEGISRPCFTRQATL